MAKRVARTDQQEWQLTPASRRLVKGLLRELAAAVASDLAGYGGSPLAEVTVSVQVHRVSQVAIRSREPSIDALGGDALSRLHSELGEAWYWVLRQRLRLQDAQQVTIVWRGEQVADGDLPVMIENARARRPRSRPGVRRTRAPQPQGGRAILIRDDDH